jgi:fibronectin type 3 domain-containing protein
VTGTSPTAPTGFTAIDGGPAPTVVTTQSYINTTAQTSHTTAAFNSTGGNFIVVTASCHSGVTFTASDNFGNTYIPIAGPTSANSGLGFDLRTQIWYAPNPFVGPGHTVTIGLSAAQPLVISVIVGSGSNSAAPIDAVSLIGSDNGTQTINVVSPSITTAEINDLLIGFVKVSTSTTPEAGPGFTVQTGATLSNLVAETGLAATAGTYDATFTLSQTESWESAVVAVANNPNQTTLSWTASTESGGTIANYLVERCQGVGCTSFAQIGTTALNTYNDTGLTAATSYSYRVRAEDTNNNIGPYSGVATVTTPTPIPPTPSAPENLTAAGPIVVASQSYLNATALTSGTTAAFNSTGGNLILLAASSPAGVTFTPTDNLGNSWTSLAGPTSTTTGSLMTTQLWYVQNPIVGAGHTVTVGLSTAEPLEMSVIVVANASASSPIDVTSLIGSDNGSETTSVTSPSVTTTGLNDLLIGFGSFSSDFNTGTYASLAGTGFAEQTGGSSNLLVAESGPAATPASRAATFVLGSAQNWQSAVVAAENNPSQTTLSWTTSADVGGNEAGGTISTYLVERCQGAGCTNFSQIGTATGTTYHDTGLTAATSYSYRVRAEDSADIVGPYSGVVSVTTPSSSAPSAPSNLIASADRTGPMILTWTASTSSVGIADYVVERCQGAGCTNFAQIGTSTGTSYTDSAVVSSTIYSYEVQAVDIDGNVSPFSNIATNTTVGTSPPTAPGNLGATAVSASQINLSWTASTSSLGIANYVVQRCQGAGCTNFAQIATPTGTTYSDTGLLAGTSYSYQAEAIDIEGNVSPFSNIASATTLSPVTTITYVQGNYATPQAAESSVTVAFTAAQVAGDLNVVAVGWNDSSAAVTGVTDKSGNTYTLAVGPTVQSGYATQSIYYAKKIVGAAAGANIVTVTFSPAAEYPDVRILEYSGADPNNPVDVTAASSGNSATSSSGSVTTTVPTDLLFAANLVQSTTTGPGASFTSRLLTQPDGDIAEDRMVTTTGSYSATAPIAPANPWIMQMVAFHTALTCTGAPPTAPSNLTATAISSSQINVSWTASTSCYGIASYIVERCQGASCSNFTQIATPTGVTFTDTGLAANTSYTYQVQAMDNSGNLSAFATPATATTLAISISPRFSALTFTQTQQFTSSAGVTWSVDGVTGGSTTTGTISTTGLYTPPSAVGTHTVTATTSSQQSASATVYITNYPGTYTYHNDNLRTGQNLSETVLTYSNVNQNQFGKLFSYPLDGMAFASPLYVASVNIPGQGYHNVVYVATENDSIYAFDADGLSTTPLWHTSFLSSGVTPIPCADVGGCGDIPIQIGITSTPVIDPTTGTIYVVAATMEGAGVYVQRLHALDITTGLDKFGGPVVIQGSVPGTGEGSTSGSVPFNSLVENQRPGLLLNNGVVYLGFGSHNDTLPWHGWVLGYNATTLAQTMQFNATPNGYGGGIWQSGGGLAADQNGNIYFSTSNGPFDVNTGGVDYGDSIMQITPSGTVGGYFTPYDQANMGANNLDLGAAGPVLLVNQTTGSYPHLLISAGKTGTIYVINRDNMGGYNANNNDQIVQYLQGVLPNGNDESGNFSQPVYYNGYVYFGAVNDAIKAFQLTNGLLSTAPTSQTAAIYEVRGASFAISANGTSNGILWALQNNGTSADTDNTGNPGVLFAYNANNLGTELYDSTQAGSRDTLDLAAKFSIPLVANGKVFIAGQTRLTVFGLLP